MSDFSYGWRAGVHPPAPADRVGLELERIEKKRGAITPEIVVAESMRKRSPLHDYIHGKSDAELAQEARIGRARYVLRGLVIRVEGGDGRELRARVSVIRDDQSEYVSASEAAEDPELRSQVSAGLTRRLTALERDLQSWREFAEAHGHVVSALAALKEAA